MHAIWELLLDDEFMEAYEHGIVVNARMEFSIGSIHIFLSMVLITQKSIPFLQIKFTSVDSFHRVLLATIKSLGPCPCPRCHIRKDQIGDLGTINDMKRRTNVREDNSQRQEKVEKAHQGIFKKGYSVMSNVFWNLMDLTSLVPI
jgi:hypothetical protein